ncbi:hypothetical protein [Parachitinimonas caeni]|uniref:Uncharacterized protein n=1 Tax=Parachitinimonas caeni TaxID=3031301 RepID=A0ABT7DRP2_9NEIS|nr:hypothetical protein [Parachitinimonas caeni]MDK2122736.1 hypothetical protein [Parachitinimonas caeni]
MQDMDAIKEQVEKNGNVLTVSMEQLKDIHGAGRLGSHVRQEISRALEGVGLAHVPRELPSYQHELVRLYKRGTDIGQFIEKVLSPGEESDKWLLKKISSKGPDYAEIIQKIRDLVSD